MENIRKTVLLNFTRLLESSGMKQKFIAQKLGVSETTVMRWKKGEVFPELDNIEALAEVFGVPISAFFEPGIEKKPTINQALEVLGLEMKSKHPLHEKIEEFLSDSPSEKQVESLMRSIDAATKAAQISNQSKNKKKELA